MQLKFCTIIIYGGKAVTDIGRVGVRGQGSWTDKMMRVMTNTHLAGPWQQVQFDIRVRKPVVVHRLEPLKRNHRVIVNHQRW